MRKRILSASLCLIALLSVPLTLILFVFALPPQYTETFLGGFSDKLAALQSAPGRRIILAGGSGTVFAVRSDLLEQELPGYRVVNLGMYAGLGSTVPLDAAADELRPGDVVVFLPEQSEQTLTAYFGSEFMWQAADGHWSLLRAVRREHWPAMLGQFPYFAAQKAAYFFQRQPPKGEGVYIRSALNAWGDLESPLREANRMPGGHDANVDVTFSADLPSAEFLSYVNDYADMCAAKGATFYFGFCPMNAAAIPDSVDSEALAAYEQRLADQLDCPVIGSVKDSILDAVWFYDTNFHLNSAGAIVFTARLTQQLQRALGLPEQFSFPLPEKPAAYAAGDETGNDTDADCFCYRETAEGLIITGLTEEGASRSQLTLPTHADGKPVAGFDTAVFAGNTTIETITLQANLRSIGNGSFEGCSRLERIILSDVSPSECTVGAELLRGTHAVIEVDAALLAVYQTNYFWAVHADRIHATEGMPSSQPAVLPDAPEPAAGFLRYHGNGGCLRTDADSAYMDVPLSNTHLRTNTLQGIHEFVRPGYQLLGWNTESDGSGTFVGLGSRIAASPGMTLYAQWAAESPADDFTWTVSEDTVVITGYRGTQEVCVVPSAIDGRPVRRIAQDAFRLAALDTVLLPPSVEVIEPNAFFGSTLSTLYLSDTLQTISDSSFTDCTHLTTLHLNAATAPVYSISYYATFADKYDWLLSLRGQRKLVLFSGSSTRYGYDSDMLHRAYPSYSVANMGVYAYTNALPQLDLILPCMESGDVLLHAPEFDTLNHQLCESNALDFHFWAMMEANYDCVSMLNLQSYTQVFDSLQKYLTIRRNLPARTYADSPNGYDDDGNNHRAPTYNQVGDLILPREGSKIDVMLQHIRAEYTPAALPPERIARINQEYQRYLDRGIRVLFTYTPRNRSSLTGNSTPENRAALDRLLRDSLCVPVISRIEDSLMSGVYFYLIDSHLSSEGVRLHTLQIIEDLAPWLEGKE